MSIDFSRRCTLSKSAKNYNRCTCLEIKTDDHVNAVLQIHEGGHDGSDFYRGSEAPVDGTDCDWANENTFGILFYLKSPYAGKSF